MPPPRHPPPSSPHAAFQVYSLTLALMFALLSARALAEYAPRHDCLTYDVWHRKLDDCKRRAIDAGMTNQQVDCLISGGSRFPPDVITVDGAQMQCYNKTAFGDHMAYTMVSCVEPERYINNNNDNTITSTTTTTTTDTTSNSDSQHAAYYNHGDRDDDDEYDDDDDDDDYDDYYDPQAVQASPMPAMVRDSVNVERRVSRLPDNNNHFGDDERREAQPLPPHQVAVRLRREVPRGNDMFSRLARVLRMRNSSRRDCSCASGCHLCCVLEGVGGKNRCFSIMCSKKNAFCV